MKDYQSMKIIGIDNGYGNIKIASCCFPAGTTACDAEPVFKDDLLTCGGKFYLIGTGHKEFAAVASQLRDFQGVNMLCNIGNGKTNIMMVDTNIQRENISPIEKAKALKMKMEALKRQAGRPPKGQENNSPQVAANFRSDDEAAISKISGHDAASSFMPRAR